MCQTLWYFQQYSDNPDLPLPTDYTVGQRRQLTIIVENRLYGQIPIWVCITSSNCEQIPKLLCASVLPSGKWE